MGKKSNQNMLNFGILVCLFAIVSWSWTKVDTIPLEPYAHQLTSSIQEVSNASNLPAEVIPGGELVGVKILSDGIYVVGTSDVETGNGIENPCKNKVEKGDRIYEVNDKAILSKEQLRAAIEKNNQQDITLTLKRENEEHKVTITPVYSEEEDAYKLGLWVKDGTQGIGTVTYINPETREFGALGHGINDSDIKALIPIKKGEIIPAEITSITKGQKGDAGHLNGVIEYSEELVMGDVSTNTSIGIYGRLNEKGLTELGAKPLPVASQNEIHEGHATILTSLSGKGPTAYRILIEKVSHYNKEPSKGMVIRIIDQELLDLTNGIVQGMSGSPIIQDGKLIGAVTHVFVQDPTKGYGIFIENMINNKIN